MQAIVIRESGGPDVLEYKTVPDLKPERGEVLVRIKAVGVNRADVLQRQGKYPPPPGAALDIPGLEFAGDVVAVGPGALRFKTGRKVPVIEYRIDAVLFDLFVD